MALKKVLSLLILLASLLIAACGDDSGSNNGVEPVIAQPVVTFGSVTDIRDGQTYKTVKIGDQVWMAENLNFQEDSSLCYNDEDSNCTKYGRYYRWAMAVGMAEGACGNGHTCSLPPGIIQGICPIGWHLPDTTEWNTLFAAVGGSMTAGKKLKSTFGWNDGGNGTDDFGFSVLPAGSVNRGSHGEGVIASFWSSVEIYGGSSYSFVMEGKKDAAYLDSYTKDARIAVRCLKD